MRRVVCFAHVALVLAMAAFGGLNVVVEVALDGGIHPLVFGFYRDLLACPFLLCWTSAAFGWKRFDTRKDVLLMASLGVFGLCGNQLLYLIGLHLTDGITASVYQSLTPVVTVALAIFPFRYEDLCLVKVLGVAIGVSGSVFLILFDSRGSKENGRPLRDYVFGHLILVAQIVCFSLFFIQQKPLLGRYSPQMILTVSYTIAVAALALCCLPLIGRDVWRIGDAGGYWALAYSGIVCSCLSYQLMTWSNQYLDASITSCYAIVQPVSTGIIAYFALGRSLGWKDVVGCVLILCGLVLASSSNATAGSKQTGYEEELLKIDQH